MVIPSLKAGSQGSSLRVNPQDIIAGLSIAGLLLPEAIAYSRIGNLPAQTGIIAVLVGLICYGLIGSSRFAIVSATSSSAAVLAAGIASIDHVDSGYGLMLAFGLVISTGLLLLGAALARLGDITDFIAKPVLRGFAFGLAITIILRQVASIVGVHADHGEVLQLISALFHQFAVWNWVGLAIASIALALLFLLARFRHMPAALVVIALGIAVGHYIELARYGVNVVGAIDLGIAAPTWPALMRSDWLRLGELGFAMAMILYSESYGSIRTFAMKHGDAVRPNRDLLALGVSNLVSGLLHGMPIGAGFSATSANEVAGAVSQRAGLVAAMVIFAIALTMLPVVALTPEPILAAIVIHAVSRSLGLTVFKPYFRWHRDRLVILAAIAGVLLLGVLDGLLAAIAVSLLMMLRRFSESEISVLGRLGQGHDFVNINVHPEAKPIDGMTILRPDEPLFFANAERILKQARDVVTAAGPANRTIILSLEESPDLDSSSLEALQDFFRFAAKAGKQLLLTRLKHPVHEILKTVIEGSVGVGGSAEAPFLSGLSVDEAVRIAREHTDSAASVAPVN